MSDLENLDKLLPEEKLEISRLYSEWSMARLKKEYAAADRLRSVLEMRGADVNGISWHPAYEHNLYRQRRAALRFAKYGVPMYPWGVDL